MSRLSEARAGDGRGSQRPDDDTARALPALWLASTEALDRDRIAASELAASLSADERQQWRSIQVQRDRDLYLVAHHLKRRVLSMYQSGIDDAGRVATTAHGQPVAVAEHVRSDLRCDLSYSDGLAAVLITRGQACGVEVERAGPDRDMDHRRLAHASFHPEEARDIERRGAAAFYQTWTLKRAFARLTGAALDSFHIELDPSPRVVVDAGAARADVELFHCRLPGDHVVAAALRGRATRWPPTMHWLAELAGERPSSAWWLRITRPAAPRLRLFCFPFAGALPGYFRQWTGRVAGDVELWALQLPGRGARAGEPLLRDMHAITTALITAISPHLDVPFVFFGHSMGAAVSFALARRLRDHGLPLPAHMIVSGCRPVHLERRPPYVHQMNLDELIDELRILGGTPGAVLDDRDMIEFYSPAIRADFEVIETYQPDPVEPLPVPVSIWAGASDPRVDVATVDAWGELFARERRVTRFPGGHMFIDSSHSQRPCLDELERVLAGCAENPAHHHQQRTGT